MVLRPRAVLALTATATPPTRASIRGLLDIPIHHQVVESPLRDNLALRVVQCAAGASRSGTVAAHVVQLLKTGGGRRGRGVRVLGAKSSVTGPSAAQAIGAGLIRGQGGEHRCDRLLLLMLCALIVSALQATSRPNQTCTLCELLGPLPITTTNNQNTHTHCRPPFLPCCQVSWRVCPVPWCMRASRQQLMPWQHSSSAQEWQLLPTTRG